MLIMRAGFHCRRLVSRLRDRDAEEGDDDDDDGDDPGGNGSVLVATPPGKTDPAKAEPPNKTDNGDAVSDGHEEHDPAEPKVIQICGFVISRLRFKCIYCFIYSMFCFRVRGLPATRSRSQSRTRDEGKKPWRFPLL